MSVESSSPGSLYGRLAFMGILAIALGLRVWGLGQPSLDIDEYLHVFAAQSLNEAGQPRLPSGNLYTRSLPYTWLVAQSFRWFGTSDASARWPSVVIDLVGLCLIYGFTRRWIGEAAALLTAGILATAPWWILAAKNCRMYTLFHAGMIAAAWATWESLEGPRHRRWLWAAVATGVWALTIIVHSLAQTFVISVGLFILGQAFLTGDLRYRVLSGLGVIAVAAMLGLGLIDPVKLWADINTVPNWAAWARYDWGFYLRRWWAVYPTILIAYPISLWWLWRRDQALAWYLICIGTVLFLLHSFVFDWKTPRYVLYLLPWLIMPVAAMVGHWLTLLRVSRRLSATVAATALLLLVLNPWIWEVGTASQQFPAPPWRSCYTWLARRLGSQDVVLTSMPLATLHYLGRPASYVMNNVHVDNAGFPAVRRPTDGLYVDGYAGRPMVTSLDELKTVIRQNPRGWILIDQIRLNSAHAVPPAVRDYIQARLEPVPAIDGDEGQNQVIVYRWDERVRQAALGMARSG